MHFTLKNYLSLFTHPAHGSGFKAWYRTLADNNFAVDPLLIPKAVSISLTSALSSPFRWYEKIKYANDISLMQVKRPVFILGHPRSGTTFLHYLMSKDSSFAYCTTLQAMLPHLFLTGSGVFRPMLAMTLPDNRPMDNLKMGASLPKEEEFALASMGAESLVSAYYFPKNYLRNFRRYVLFDKSNPNLEKKWLNNYDYLLRKLSFANEQKMLLLKSPGNTGRLPLLHSQYPDARFIHIVRNPFDVYKSNLHLYKKLLPQLSFQRVNENDIKEFVIESYRLLMIKYLEDKKKLPPESIVEINYEDLVKDPVNTFSIVYQQTGLESFKSFLPVLTEELKAYDSYKKNVLPLDDTDKNILRDKWSFAFDAFSYSMS